MTPNKAFQMIGNLAVCSIWVSSARADSDCLGWTQRQVIGPTGGAYAEMAFDSLRGEAVLFGGFTDGGVLLDETWLFDGELWTKANPSNRPSARYIHSMAFDEARGEVVLFGGSSQDGLTFYDDTWVWDGENWMELDPENRPVGRCAHALSYDSARGVIVLFGGRQDPENSANWYDDTWEWDGETWTERQTTNRPAARYDHALAYDSTRGVTVLFGGGDHDSYATDTWEWDGFEWFERFPTIKPPAREDHTFAYDETAQACVLFGGAGPSGGGYVQYNTIWEWDGFNWSERAPSPAPKVRDDHVMAYDSWRQLMVVYGGYNVNDGTKNYLEDTWELIRLSLEQNPLSQTVVVGATSSFAVTAKGSESLDYQWRKDGTDLVDDERITGATTATLLISPTFFSDSGDYDVVVTNGCGTITSQAALLTVLCDGDANGDGTVDPLDAGYVQARFGCEVGTGDAECDAADVNADGVVDPLDVGYVLARFGECS